MASPAQPGGPGWFVTEFGATSSPALLTSITSDLDAAEVGWSYWAWKYYGDPTGSAAESLVMADGHLRSTALVLSRTYPQAVAGVPVSFDFSPSTGVFHLVYVPDHRVHAPTLVFVPTVLHYPDGYCARTSGAKVTSAPGSDLLQVQNARSGHRVTVVVTPGHCRGG
jgi:endoglycosylceramidase